MSSIDKDKTPTRLEAKVARADVPNGNKRIYPRAILEREVARFKKDRTMMGQLKLRSSKVTYLSDVSHVVTNLKMKNDYLVAEIEVLNTPQGRILENSLRETTFRCSGIGSGKVDNKGVLTISDSYKLIAIDAVPIEKAAKI